jgi:hypothetical protein
LQAGQIPGSFFFVFVIDYESGGDGSGVVNVND